MVLRVHSVNSPSMKMDSTLHERDVACAREKMRTIVVLSERITGNIDQNGGVKRLLSERASRSAGDVRRSVQHLGKIVDGALPSYHSLGDVRRGHVDFRENTLKKLCDTEDLVQQGAGCSSKLVASEGDALEVASRMEETHTLQQSNGCKINSLEVSVRHTGETIQTTEAAINGAAVHVKKRKKNLSSLNNGVTVSNAQYEKPEIVREVSLLVDGEAVGCAERLASEDAEGKTFLQKCWRVFLKGVKYVWKVVSSFLIHSLFIFAAISFCKKVIFSPFKMVWEGIKTMLFFRYFF